MGVIMRPMCATCKNFLLGQTLIKKYLHFVVFRGTLLQMKKPNSISRTGGVRLPYELWPMFRAIMQAKGRPWFESWIRRTYKAMEK
jgi:hypothetical protein